MSKMWLIKKILIEPEPNKIPYVKTTIRNYAMNIQSINKITNKTLSRKLFAWGVLDVFNLKCY
jgi:hypothetical protein